MVLNVLRVKLPALLDEHDSQTQKQFAQQLDVSQRVVSDSLQEMGKTQKTGRWVPHELNDRQMEKCKNICNILLARYKKKSRDENWVYFENSKRK